MSVSKRWHIVLSTTESSRPVNISLPKKIGLFFCSLAVVFVLLFTGSVFYIIHNQNKISQAQSVLNENELLKDKLFFLSSEIDSIMAKLQLMEDWEDDIRLDKNFKLINKEIREMGIGGLPQVDTTFISINNELNLNYNLTLNKITQLKSKVEFDYQSHGKLLDQVQLKELLYKSTPSIYPTYGRISDGYGMRIHPITKRRTFHYGIDFANKKGSPIYATADGVVRSVGKLKLLGKYISISHQFGYKTLYAHLYKFYVKKGDAVKRGQIIGEMGDSGRSTGTHLHYEVLRYNKHRNPYNHLNKLEDDIVLTKK